MNRIAGSRSRLLLIAWILGAASPIALDAQPFPALDRVQISIWPEYDRPAALVIMSGWLPVTTALPAVAVLPMPTSAGAPSAVAKRGVEGTLLLAEWEADPQGDTTFVSIRTDVPEVRVEYYAGLETTDSARNFQLFWPGGMEVGQMRYEVMQPLGASGLTIEPPALSRRVGSDGMTYFAADLGSKGPADAFTIALTYSKSGNELTAAAMQPTFSPPQEPAATTPAPEPDSTDSIWLVVLPVVLAVAAIVLWFTLGSRR